MDNTKQCASYAALGHLMNLVAQICSVLADTLMVNIAVKEVYIVCSSNLFVFYVCICIKYEELALVMYIWSSTVHILEFLHVLVMCT